MSPDAAIVLESFLDEERGRVDAALERALGALTPLVPERLRAPIRDGVLAGGKRLRPILCVAAYRAAGGDAEGPGGDRGTRSPSIYDLAAAVELIHAYSLMHDDLPCMDDAPLRRGRPTPHTVRGEPRTMSAGAALIPLAALQAWRSAEALGLAPERGREIVRILCDAAGSGGMVGGQALDLLGEGRRLGRDQLDRLHRMKTGALLGGSLAIGAVAAGAGDRARAALERYGAAVGLAFQVTDDLLDATSTAEELGKNPSDLALDKSTYVALLGVEGARDEAEACANTAVRVLDEEGLRTPELEALARFVVRRSR